MNSADYLQPSDTTSVLETGADYLSDKLPRIDLGSIAIDTHTQTALLDEVLHHALSGKVTRQVATANAQFYVLAKRSRRFRKCLQEASYICADGMPLAWACNTFAGGQVPRIAGVDLIEKVCRGGAPHHLRVFLLGGKPEAAAQTADSLARRYPGIQVTGVSCPPFGFERDKTSLLSVLRHIAAAQPQVLFVGLGAPKQEFFIQEHVKPLGIPLAIGIGGSFEILSGKMHRAPAWMQSSGLEWAYRLSQEPRRLWRRYLIGNAEFIWRLAQWKISKTHPSPLQCSSDYVDRAATFPIQIKSPRQRASRGVWMTCLKLVLLAACCAVVQAQAMPTASSGGTLSAFVAFGGNRTHVMDYTFNSLGVSAGLVLQRSAWLGVEVRGATYPMFARFSQTPVTAGFRFEAPPTESKTFRPYTYVGGGFSKAQDAGLHYVALPAKWSPCWQVSTGMHVSFRGWSWNAYEATWSETFTPQRTLGSFSLTTGVVTTFR